MAFPNLFRSLDLGFLVLKNRVVMGSLPVTFGNDKAGVAPPRIPFLCEQ
jgi:2,4-dienoyl-CoA reductase-like NADH-dependent reductase (Old Yellow Enzyme family)